MLKSSVCWVGYLPAAEREAHHGPVEEGVDVEHGLQLQRVIQAAVLVTVAGRETQARVRRRGSTRFQFGQPLCVAPVHAPQSQVDVWILEQHSGKEVLLGGMDQERRVDDLQTHACVFMSTELQCCPVTEPGPKGTERRKRRAKAQFHIRYLEQLSVSQRLAQQLLHVAADDKQSGYDAHQHPGEDEGEPHPAERGTNTGTSLSCEVNHCPLGHAVATVTYAISRFPPVFDRQPLVVGVACLS